MLTTANPAESKPKSKILANTVAKPNSGTNRVWLVFPLIPTAEIATNNWNEMKEHREIRELRSLLVPNGIIAVSMLKKAAERKKEAVK